MSVFNEYICLLACSLEKTSGHSRAGFPCLGPSSKCLRSFSSDAYYNSSISATGKSQKERLLRENNEIKKHRKHFLPFSRVHNRLQL